MNQFAPNPKLTLQLEASWRLQRLAKKSFFSLTILMIASAFGVVWTMPFPEVQPILIAVFCVSAFAALKVRNLKLLSQEVICRLHRKDES
ncbi:MAG: hypothetical protein N4A53_01140 [Pelagimonas sp.]|jgi:chromate transport protein ChrA|nr:hypothetical protein [Pelagimonas sp.]